MDVTGLDLTATARLLADGTLSAVELTRVYLARIERFDRTLDCFVTLTAEPALADAAASDARAARGERRGPLDGIPIALKDNIDLAGVPTTNGLAARRHAIARRDAHVVARLRAAGGVTLGKLNMHEIALGGTTDNPHLGRTANPHRPDCTPGGSSGDPGPGARSVMWRPEKQARASVSGSELEDHPHADGVLARDRRIPES